MPRGWRRRAQRSADGRHTAFEVAHQLPWTRRNRHYDELDTFNRQLAVSETAAHLDLLADQGSVSVDTVDGVRRYSATG